MKLNYLDLLHGDQAMLNGDSSPLSHFSVLCDTLLTAIVCVFSLNKASISSPPLILSGLVSLGAHLLCSCISIDELPVLRLHVHQQGTFSKLSSHLI